MQYKVLADEVNKQANTVDFHVLVAAQPKHDEAERSSSILYRHLMTRAEPQPAARRRLRLQRRGAVQDAAALAGRRRRAEAGRRRPHLRQQGAARVLAAGRSGAAAHRQGLEAEQEDRAQRRAEDAHHHRAVHRARRGSVGRQALVQPGDGHLHRYRQGAVREGARAEGHELHRPLEGPGRGQDRHGPHATIRRCNIGDIEEQIGQLHGRAFLELSTGNGSTRPSQGQHASAWPPSTRRCSAQLKGHAWPSRRR